MLACLPPDHNKTHLVRPLCYAASLSIVFVYFMAFRSRAINASLASVTRHSSGERPGRLLAAFREERSLHRLLEKSGHDNNLNLLRLLAALAVTLSHSWPLTGAADEPLAAATGFLSLGSLAVHVFFVISGLLVARSFDGGGGVLRYLAARALRIYPGLIVMLLLTILVAALALSTLAMGDFLSHEATWAYLKRNLRFATAYELPGVFRDNPYANAVNGSLWTLRHEIQMYLVVVLVGGLGLLRRRWAFNLLFALFVLAAANPAVGQLVGLDRIRWEVLILFVCFSFGSFFYVNRSWLVFDLRVAIALWALLAFLPRGSRWFYLGYIAALAYTTIWLGYCARYRGRCFCMENDLSYGIYIYSFPLQQCLAMVWRDSGPWAHFLVAVILVLPMAALSWWWVEKPALGFKNTLNGGQRRTQPGSESTESADGAALPEPVGPR